MAYTPDPQRAVVEAAIAKLKQKQSFVIQAPTGCGKTRMSGELFRWAAEHGMQGAFYASRRLLIGQTYNAFENQGLELGIRAAEFDSMANKGAPFQICSTNTEYVRCIKPRGDREKEDLHNAKLVIVDEGHLQRGEMMQSIIAEHRMDGANVVIISATPVGMSHMVDDILCGARLRDWRECGAIVPVKTYSIEQPDMRKVKRNAAGEYIWKGKRKKIYIQSIVGNVIDQWKTKNGDARPTLLYAPGVEESVWFTERFSKRGINWCHVDASDCIIDGKRRKMDQGAWLEIQSRLVDGTIKGVSSRFKLREGVDLPFAYHAIIATPIGSLTSYLQIIGRIMRRSAETPEEVICTDHGGCYWRFGSPNHDRPWEAFFHQSEGQVHTSFQDDVSRGEEKEPIRCPQCGLERRSGIECPECKYVAKRSQRKVVQADGTLKIRDGNLVTPKRIKLNPTTQAEWTGMFWGHRKKTDRTFLQMEAWFCKKYGYWPPRTLDWMPKKKHHWAMKVKNVPLDALKKPEESVGENSSGNHGSEANPPSFTKKSQQGLFAEGEIPTKTEWF